ncbi:MAG: SPOR domain-containing protein [Bacteroidetes bacterium]|nr:SPOR domain-containing protein [Bacteroidota bacterium]
MGNLNFQDDQDENPQENQPDPSEQKETKIEEGFIDDPTRGSSKLLWAVIIVVVIAGIGGALYMMNRAGYLKFPIKKRPAITTTTAPAPSAVSPAPKERVTSTATKPPVGQQGSFALQVSAFRTRQQADRFVASLRKKGIEAGVFVSEGARGGKWFRVCTGSFDTKLKAIAAVENMKKKVGTDVWVVPAQ